MRLGGGTVSKRRTLPLLDVTASATLTGWRSGGGRRVCMRTARQRRRSLGADALTTRGAGAGGGGGQHERQLLNHRRRRGRGPASGIRRDDELQAPWQGDGRQGEVDCRTAQHEWVRARVSRRPAARASSPDRVHATPGAQQLDQQFEHLTSAFVARRRAAVHGNRWPKKGRRAHCVAHVRLDVSCDSPAEQRGELRVPQSWVCTKHVDIWWVQAKTEADTLQDGECLRVFRARAQVEERGQKLGTR
eukprot:scaffold172683_cov23-Tisochrysis_lutea.AAC.2